MNFSYLNFIWDWLVNVDMHWVVDDFLDWVWLGNMDWYLHDFLDFIWNLNC